MPALSIIMPCYNRAHDLARILQAYDHQAGSDSFELIAVDDGSSDHTYQILSTYQPGHFHLHLIKLERNQGPANARNHGIAAAQAPLILMVGDDIRPDPHLVSAHLQAHHRYPEKEVAILGKVQWPSDMPVNTLMRHINGVGAQQFSYHYFKDGKEYDYRHFYTANISIHRDFLLSDDHLFDSSFPYAAFEDVELSYRLAQKGLKIIYLSNPVGFHYHYHTIWSFSNRQYRAGLMADVLVRKHPRTRDLIMGKNWPLRRLELRLLSPLNNQPDGTASQLENKTLHLLSSFEWKPHRQLDYAYLNTLRYYFVKGLMHGRYGESALANRLLNTHASRVLKPILALFP